MSLYTIITSSTTYTSFKTWTDIKFINQTNISAENKQILLSLLEGKETIKRHELIGLVDQCKIKGSEQIKNKLCSLYSHKVIIERIRAKFSNVYTYGSGALFISSKKGIQQVPKDYWQEIYASLQEKNPASGYGLEKMWRYLLT